MKEKELKLLNCPFCGNEARSIDIYIHCSNKECPLWEKVFEVRYWNKRTPDVPCLDEKEVINWMFSQNYPNYPLTIDLVKDICAKFAVSKCQHTFDLPHSTRCNKCGEIVDGDNSAPISLQDVSVDVEEFIDNVQQDIIGHIDTMYPDMWKSVAKIARKSLKNTIKSTIAKNINNIVKVK